jgi:hypothetical protein
MNPQRDVLVIGFITALLIVAVLFLTSCGTTREETEQKKTVERIETLTGPLVVDIPLVGQVVAQPVRHIMQRTQDTVTNTTEEKRVNLPEAGAIMQAATSATPWGGIIGMATTAAAGYLALRRGKEAETAKRHRDQLIDSVEKARDELPDDADEKFTRVLGVKQDKDLQDYIKARTTP